MDEEARELAHFKSESGQIIGMDLPLDDHMQDKVTKGYLHRVNEDGTPFVDHSEGSDLTNGVPPRPAVNAAKAEWVGHAVNVLGLEPDEAEAMTKQDLIDRANQ